MENPFVVLGRGRDTQTAFGTPCGALGRLHATSLGRANGVEGEPLGSARRDVAGLQSRAPERARDGACGGMRVPAYVSRVQRFSGRFPTASARLAVPARSRAGKRAAETRGELWIQFATLVIGSRRPAGSAETIQRRGWRRSLGTVGRSSIGALQGRCEPL